MDSNGINLARLLRPHWRKLVVAFIAVIGITAADVLQPWPLKIVLDYVLAGRRMPPRLASFLALALGNHKSAILGFAVLSVAAITLLDAVSSYVESYVMTSVGQWVGHDIRRKVYHH